MTAQGPMGIIWVCPPPSNSGKWVGYGGQMLLGKGPTQDIPFLFPPKRRSDISSFQWSSFYAPSPRFPLQQKTISQKTKKQHF